MKKGTGGERGDRRKEVMLVFLLCLFSILLRWRIADLANWGIDEAANLWLGSLILSGQGEPLGLVSSRGIPNLAGVPLLAAPLALLPDLLAISRILSWLHMAALVLLGVVLSQGVKGTALSVGLLLFFPALLLASPSLWNQYLTAPLSALSIVLLVFLAGSGDRPRGRALAVAAFTALALLQPAVHLMCLADLAVHAFLLTTLLLLRPGPMNRRLLVMALIPVGAVSLKLYRPWLELLFRNPARIPFGPLEIVIVLCAAAAAFLLCRRSGSLLRRLVSAAAGSRIAAWAFLAALLVFAAAAAVLPFSGAQAGRRLLDAKEWSGWVLLSLQAALVMTFLPSLLQLFHDCRKGNSLRSFLEKHCPGRAPAAATLVVHGALLLAARWVLVPDLLSPGGRSDLLLPLLPALLAPLIIVARGVETDAERRTAGFVVAAAVFALFVSGFRDFSPAYRKRHARFVPPSEMRAAVDWIAARHREGRGGDSIDVGYDLEGGREWIPRIACSSWTSWYSIGRPYDWLLRRRHGLANVHEGTCDRKGGRGFQIGYLAEPGPPTGMERVHTLEHLVIRRPLDGS